MLTRLIALLTLSLVVSSACAGEGEHSLTVVASRLVTIESLTVYHTQDAKRQLAGEQTKFDKPLVLPGGGPFEVFVKPKGGVPVRVAENLTVKAGKPHELNINDLVGTVEVLGDDLPRASQVVLTQVRDVGPSEKGHVAVQTASEYRVGMAVPPGTYAVWVVPANGSRAVRVFDNVRVQAGRSVRVGD